MLASAGSQAAGEEATLSCDTSSEGRRIMPGYKAAVGENPSFYGTESIQEEELGLVRVLLGEAPGGLVQGAGGGSGQDWEEDGGWVCRHCYYVLIGVVILFISCLLFPVIIYICYFIY